MKFLVILAKLLPLESLNGMLNSVVRIQWVKVSQSDSIAKICQSDSMG